MSISERVEKYLKEALELFSSDEYHEIQISAKKEFMSLTGELDEELVDFELKMRSFNDWYLMHFRLPRTGQTIIEEYTKQQTLDENVKEAFFGFNYSIFEYTKSNFQKKRVLKDLINKKNIVLPAEHPEIGLLPHDLLTGRVIKLEGVNYLLKGICVIPSDVKNLIKKEIKRIRKLDDYLEKIRFLYKLEYLQSKWIRYKHVGLEKIFDFAK